MSVKSTEAGGEQGCAPAVGCPQRSLRLETRGLSRAVAGKIILNDVSVAVEPGEMMAVVGPSGAGKSTFLRLLNRLDEPTGGTVLPNGQDYREIDPRALRRRVGMVMQTVSLFPGTVADNIAFGLKPQRRHQIARGADRDGACARRRPRRDGRALCEDRRLREPAPAPRHDEVAGPRLIPDVMAGMVISGTSPVYAGVYQFIVVAMILAAAGVTGLAITLLIACAPSRPTRN